VNNLVIATENILYMHAKWLKEETMNESSIKQLA
jgi:hypothetical protein